ncbi:MAG: WYL domain-containing protein [Clostridiales bacterium]|nr:WYL domain-containing protein [Clostridiales bacterium]
MAKSYNQKLKILYLMQMLLERSDEEHPLTMEEIIAGLNANGISAERKSIYDDMEALRLYGLDVCYTRGKTTGYYIGSRTFELPELKLLIDSVQSSKFITEKKTFSLIKKLVSLGSIHEGQLLRRQVFVRNRIKSMNESIYYNVDHIHGAIASDKQITFYYFEYDVNKQKRFRKDGQRYCVSPFALSWDDENYYLIAFDAEAGILKHYRVDKMSDIRLTEQERLGKDTFRNLDMALYTKRTFAMFGGEETMVTIRFCNNLIGVVMDKFGKDIMIHKVDEEHFSVTAPVMVSPQFYAWVFGLGSGAVITAPKSVADGMEQMLKDAASQYQNG